MSEVSVGAKSKCRKDDKTLHVKSSSIMVECISPQKRRFAECMGAMLAAPSLYTKGLIASL